MNKGVDELTMDYLTRLNDLPFFEVNKSDLTLHWQQRTATTGAKIDYKFKTTHCLNCSVKLTPQNSTSLWKVSKRKKRWETVTCKCCGAVNHRGGSSTVVKQTAQKTVKQTKTVTKAAIKQTTKAKTGMTLDDLLSGL